MSYYDTNTEIANTFNVSKTTVSRWLEGSIEGRNNLIVEKRDKKVYVLKNEHNYAEMLKLKEEGLKYKASTSYVEVTPKDEFYRVFSDSQQIEIINLLETKRVIPLKFSYFGAGAQMWDDFYVKSLKSGTYQAIQATELLINQIYSFLSQKTDKYKKVNIVDVGQGNSHPLKSLITKLIELDKMGTYIAVDISDAMHNIAKQNINTWFGNSVEYKRYIRDIEHHTLTDILFENKDEDTINLVFLLGGLMGNIENYQRVLQNFSYSLDKNDLVIQTSLIAKDTKKTDFDQLSNKDLTHFLTPKLLNIDTDQCDFSGRYDDKTSSRIGLFLADKDYCLKFNVKGVEREVLISRGEEIKIWYHRMIAKDDLFKELTLAKLELVNASVTPSLSHIITICQAANN